MKTCRLMRHAVLFSSVFFLVITFQNCSKVQFADAPLSEDTVTALPTDPIGSLTCSFNGETLQDGEGALAFLNSTVPAGSECQSEDRICSDGQLSGSYNYASCTVGDYASCLFDGRTISHGQSVKAYQNSSVSYGSNCQEESRTCTNGVLSGSYAFSSCAINQPASCLFNGQTVAHGQSINAYATSSVAFGMTCNSQQRTCNNGALSGSYQYGNCAVAQPASCLFNGQTIAHGQSIPAFLTSSVSYGSTCTSQSRTCTNGALSGSYQYGSCSAAQPASCLLNGQTIAHGQGVTTYAASSVAYGQTCASQVRQCVNGSLSGSYSNTSCYVQPAPASCTFNGASVAHGKSIRAYQSPSGAPSCQSENRTCTNGTLSGSFTYNTCTSSRMAWTSHQVTFSPCSGPTLADGRTKIQCSESNKGQFLPGEWCGASGWTCTRLTYIYEGAGSNVIYDPPAP